MIYHNINTKSKRLPTDIIEQQMIYQIKEGLYKEIQKSIIFFRNRQKNTRKKKKKSTWKAIIKEKSEERMNREIQKIY